MAKKNRPKKVGEVRRANGASPALGEKRLSAQKDGNESQQEYEHTTGQWDQPWNDVNNLFDGINLALLLVVVMGGVRHEGSCVG
jgi:hypothetical protein